MTRLTRRQFVAALSAAAAVGATGCASVVRDQSVTSSGNLTILNWPDYLDLTLLGGAETATGASIRYAEDWEDNYSGADLVASNLELGQVPDFDVITPTNWLAAQWISAGWIQELPLELIPNHVNIDPVFLTNGWDRGARFHMPWQSGITGIAYDPARVDEPITSVAQLFDPALAGRVAMIGEMREAVGLAMLANGHDPARPTTATAEEGLARLDRATASGQFHSWVFDEFTTLLADGTVAATMAWSGNFVQLQAERPDLEFVIPDEGAIQWFDTMVIPQRARSAAGAAAWMNYFYDPVVAADATEWVQYISPVIGVREELQRRGGASAALADNPLLFPDDATQRRLAIWGGLDSVAAEADIDDRFAQMAGVA